MEILTNIKEAPWKKAAIAIGKFEGLHRGHQKLIQKIVQKKQEGYVSVVFTFDRSPRIYFGRGEGLLFTGSERRSKLAEWELDKLVECPFTKELAAMEPEAFVEEILCKKLHAGYLAVGPDFHFGKDRKGDVGLLARYEAQGLFSVEVVEKERTKEQEVSSTKVRELLAKGDIQTANQMLAFPFFLEGEVVKGNQMGRTWGVPTANVKIDSQKLLPPNGVYFSNVLLSGRNYNAITNIGSKPTIGKGYEKGAETYLYDFEQDIYGEKLRIELLKFQRPEQQFASLEQLVERLKYDVGCGREYFRFLQ